ncbi:hypothetical protein HH212_26585 (plasmid) [Massilia forsythiae]|uniref:Uncharacterized protein n=1 Tax=Massilia forsythiae TaxID=2728020 RepID=A0A7Z2ZVG3_9BURK|nr:hypothetical protein [Massilia forsythiae]QJE03671.1 hypothetical protein HH212_26585 [Massilia forsythiae]
MFQEISKFEPNIKQFCKYHLAYHNSARPLGIEKGAVVTADLAEVLPEFNVRQYFSTQPNIFVDYDHLVTAYDSGSGKAIGLLGARWLGSAECRFLYLWTAMIGDSHRNSMLFNRIVAYFFEKVAMHCADGALPELIVTKTYNPVVYSIFKSYALASGATIDVYPIVPAAAQDEEMVELAKRIATAISPKLVLQTETGVVPGGQAMVAPDFFPRMEESKDADVNRHFQTHLTRSDQVLCILRIDDRMRKNALQLVASRKHAAPAVADRATSAALPA